MPALQIWPNLLSDRCTGLSSCLLPISLFVCRRCTQREKPNVSWEENNNQKALLFHFSDILLSVYYFMWLTTVGESSVVMTSKHQIPAFIGIEILRIIWRLRSWWCFCQEIRAGCQEEDRFPTLSLLSRSGLKFPGKGAVWIQVKELCFENCFLNESVELSPKALEPARGKSR